jgi:hypothetical protein
MIASFGYLTNLPKNKINKFKNKNKIKFKLKLKSML